MLSKLKHGDIERHDAMPFKAAECNGFDISSTSDFSLFDPWRPWRLPHSDLSLICLWSVSASTERCEDSSWDQEGSCPHRSAYRELLQNRFRGWGLRRASKGSLRFIENLESLESLEAEHEWTCSISHTLVWSRVWRQLEEWNFWRCFLQGESKCLVCTKLKFIIS